MDVNIIMELLDRPIAYQRIFVKFGGVTGAVLLSQAVYWQKRVTRSDEFFYKTAVDWEEETGLSAKEQFTARKRLKKHEILIEKRIGIPCKLHYKVDIVKLYNLMRKTAKTSVSTKGGDLTNQDVDTSSDQKGDLVEPNSPNSNTPKGETITEITSEITSETTHIPQTPHTQNNITHIINVWNNTFDCGAFVEETLKKRIKIIVSEYGIPIIEETIVKYHEAINNDKYYWSQQLSLFEFVKNPNFATWIHKDLNSLVKYDNAKKEKEEKNKKDLSIYDGEIY